MPWKFSQQHNQLVKIYNNKTRDNKEKEKEIFNALSPEDKRIAEEKKKIADAKKAENLLDTYIDYLIIKNIYEGGSYYVTSSQMKQVKAITIATENYYKNSITSTDSVWQRAVNYYEREWAEYIATMKSSSYNTSFSGFTDLKMMGIINRASKNGISYSNTVKDF